MMEAMSAYSLSSKERLGFSEKESNAESGAEGGGSSTTS
jgi:hypothetical protein